MKRKPNWITYRITNESQYHSGDPSYTATEPRWQSTMEMMEELSMEERIFKRRKEMMSMAWCRATTTLTQSHNHSILWICSGGSRVATSPSTDDYRLQDILNRTSGSSAHSSDSASTFEHGKINDLGETYVLGFYEWDYTKLRYTIEGYDRCRLRKLPSMPSHERKLYHCNKFRQWPMPR